MAIDNSSLLFMVVNSIQGLFCVAGPMLVMGTVADDTLLVLGSGFGALVFCLAATAAAEYNGACLTGISLSHRAWIKQTAWKMLAMVYGAGPCLLAAFAPALRYAVVGGMVVVTLAAIACVAAKVADTPAKGGALRLIISGVLVLGVGYLALGKLQEHLSRGLRT